MLPLLALCVWLWTSAVLPALWRCVAVGEDGRVQEKAWTSFVEVLSRSGNLALLQEWDRTLSAGGAVCSLALSPDGRQLVSGNADGSLNVWDVPRAGPGD